MLIRSQDKKRLINLDNVQRIDAYGRKIGAVAANDDCYVEIGDYGSEAKAIKVLDMIQGTWENQTERFKYAFQMPSDEDVEGLHG
jgi:hypothetical protein